MIIIFGAGSAPVLPDLHIRDSESQEHIPVGGVEGWDDDFLQTQTVCYAPMDFQDEESGLAAASETGQYWCRRLSKVLARCSFSDAGANAVIRPLYFDKDDLETMGAPVTVNAESRMDGSNYMADMVVFETYGANKIAILIDSVSAGTVNIAVSGV